MKRGEGETVGPDRHRIRWAQDSAEYRKTAQAFILKIAQIPFAA